MTDAERLRLFRVTAGAKLFGWSVTTPEVGMLSAHHERGLARLSWPLPRTDVDEATVMTILRQPVPLPEADAAAERARLRRLATRRAERTSSFLTVARGVAGLPPDAGR